MSIACRVMFIPMLMPCGRNHLTTIPVQDSGQHVLIVTFLRKGMVIYGQKGRRGFVISGASGQKNHLHSTGRIKKGLKMPEDMYMKAVALNVMKTFFRQNCRKKEKMHIFTISRQKRAVNFIASTVI